MSSEKQQVIAIETTPKSFLNQQIKTQESQLQKLYLRSKKFCNRKNHDSNNVIYMIRLVLKILQRDKKNKNLKFIKSIRDRCKRKDRCKRTDTTDTEQKVKISDLYQLMLNPRLKPFWNENLNFSNLVDQAGKKRPLKQKQMQIFYILKLPSLRNLFDNYILTANGQIQNIQNTSDRQKITQKQFKLSYRDYKLLRPLDRQDFCKVFHSYLTNFVKGYSHELDEKKKQFVETINKCLKQMENQLTKQKQSSQISIQTNSSLIQISNIQVQSDQKTQKEVIKIEDNPKIQQNRSPLFIDLIDKESSFIVDSPVIDFSNIKFYCPDEIQLIFQKRSLEGGNLFDRGNDEWVNGYDQISEMREFDQREIEEKIDDFDLELRNSNMQMKSDWANNYQEY